MNKCRRGEIWLVSFNPARGSEQAGTRPALVIQNDIGNRYSRTTIIAAISSNVQEYPQNVVLIPTPENGLTKKSVVLLGQVLTLDQNRLIQKLGILSEQSMTQADQAIQLSLGIV